LTGSIGAGKTEVARMLGELGCFVVHSDDLGREALRDPRIKDRILDEWGMEVVDPATGEISRSALARIVFGDAAQRAILESITHPWIEARRKELFAGAPAATTAFVIDAPLLIEAGVDEHCDSVIFVDAEREIRLARLGASRGWDEAELARRESSQLPLDQKRKRADHVIINNGDLESLRSQVRTVLSRILSRST
jgi:dephospho-CoA kinase